MGERGKKAGKLAEFLHKEGAYYKFLENLKQPSILGWLDARDDDMLSLSNMLQCAFSWNMTNEKYNYWRDLNIKWLKFLRENKEPLLERLKGKKIPRKGFQVSIDFIRSLGFEPGSTFKKEDLHEYNWICFDRGNKGVFYGAGASSNAEVSEELKQDLLTAWNTFKREQRATGGNVGQSIALETCGFKPRQSGKSRAFMDAIQGTGVGEFNYTQHDQAIKRMERGKEIKPLDELKFGCFRLTDREYNSIIFLELMNILTAKAGGTKRLTKERLSNYNYLKVTDGIISLAPITARTPAPDNKFHLIIRRTLKKHIPGWNATSCPFSSSTPDNRTMKFGSGEIIRENPIWEAHRERFGGRLSSSTPNISNLPKEEKETFSFKKGKKNNRIKLTLNEPEDYKFTGGN